MKINMLVAIFVCWPFWGSVVFAATQAQIDQTWNKGLAWIMTNQHQDGGWSNTAGLGPQTTGEMLKALAKVNLKTSYTYMGGVSWLSNSESGSVDALAHQTEALKTSGEELTALGVKLKSWRNLWKGWGAYPQYESSLPDTPLAIMALMDAQSTAYSNYDIASATCQFLPAQLPSPNFLWPYSISKGTIVPPGQRSGAIVPTVYAVQALKRIISTPGRFTAVTCGGTAYTFTTIINNAVNGLLLKRKSDNGFGDGTASTIQETALVYRVLTALRPTDSATPLALDYLISQQAANGSWGGDVFFTALVLASLPAPTPLVDTDRDGIPDGVETILGKNPNLADSRFLATGSSRIITAQLLQRGSELNDSLSAKTAVPAGAKKIAAKASTAQKTKYFPDEYTDVEVFIAGSPAQLDVFEEAIVSLFREDAPVMIFNDDGGVPGQIPGDNYRAYLGTIGTTGTGLLNGKRVQIHYRSKGGSYHGVGPVAQASGIERMIIDEKCTDTDGDHFWSCPIQNTILAVPDAGISEVHPAWHVAENVPQNAITPAPEALSQLDVAPVFAGYFGVAATKALLATGVNRLGREEVVSLLAGLETTGWSGIDSSLPQKPVIICRMTDGAQPAANALFFNIPCGSQTAPARESDTRGVQGNTLSPAGLLVVENSTSHELINCLNVANNGGMLALKNPARRVRVPKNSFALGVLPASFQPYEADQWGFLSIDDAVEPTSLGAVAGASGLATNFWMQWRNDLVLGTNEPSRDKFTLLNEIRTQLQNPEILKNLPGVKPLAESNDRITESCKGER